MVTRARYGEGSIYKRTDGRSRGSLQRPDGTRQYLSARTRAHLVRNLDQAQAPKTVKHVWNGLRAARNDATA